LSHKHEHNLDFPPSVNERDVYHHEGLRDEGQEGGEEGKRVGGVVVNVCYLEGLELRFEGAHLGAMEEDV